MTVQFDVFEIVLEQYEHNFPIRDEAATLLAEIEKLISSKEQFERMEDCIFIYGESIARIAFAAGWELAKR